jgi:hypothetical protein
VAGLRIDPADRVRRHRREAGVSAASRQDRDADSHGRHHEDKRGDEESAPGTATRGRGRLGPGGDDGPATQASLAGPAGIALVPEGDGHLTIFIADYYNGLVRAVGPDGMMRNVSDEGRVAFGAPSRLAFDRRRGYLYVADSSDNQIVALNIPRISSGPLLVPRPVGAPAAPARRVG